MARTIVLGVTGSIAAYKACELVRLFVKNGDDVHVIMTDHAKEFVTPLTFRTLSRNPVENDMFADPLDWKPGHISLAEAADVLVIAPATANILAKLANGIADDLLSSVALATKAPIVVAPAMNTGMWENAATQENVTRLRARRTVRRDGHGRVGVRDVRSRADGVAAGYLCRDIELIFVPLQDRSLH